VSPLVQALLCSSGRFTLLQNREFSQQTRADRKRMVLVQIRRDVICAVGGAVRRTRTLSAPPGYVVRRRGKVTIMKQTKVSSLLALAASLALGSAVLAQNTPDASGAGAGQSAAGQSAAGQSAAQPDQSGASGAFGQSAARPGRMVDRQIMKQLSQIQQDPKTAADKLFVLNASIGNQCEVQLAQQVEQKSQNPQVKQLAQQLIKDHTAANQQLEQTAQQLQVELPQGIPMMKQQEIRIMAALPAGQFDKEFIAHNLAVHAMDVSKYQSVAQLSQNDQVKQYAQQTLPHLQQHLQEANQAAVALGIPSNMEAVPASSKIPGSSGSNGTSRGGFTAPGASSSTGGASGSSGAASGTSGAGGSGGSSGSATPRQ
jgi:putative membrane protein